MAWTSVALQPRAARVGLRTARSLSGNNLAPAARNVPESGLGRGRWLARALVAGVLADRDRAVPLAVSRQVDVQAITIGGRSVPHARAHGRAGDCDGLGFGMCEGGGVERRSRLACFDLDNTLIDRDGAFLKWGRWWAELNGLGESAVEWLVAHDNGGFRPRAELFGMARSRFGLAASVGELVASYDEEHPLFAWVEQPVLEGLAELRAAGWRVAVVTNGGTVQQNLKLEYTQIADVIDYACVSETVGIRKPDPRIFELTAARTGATLDGGWMVGDHPSHDIAGGIAAGLRTIQIGKHHTPAPSATDHAHGTGKHQPAAADHAHDIGMYHTTGTPAADHSHDIGKHHPPAADYKFESVVEAFPVILAG
ncbi:HAD family hydrolase [Kribbella sp. NPDC055110]